MDALILMALGAALLWALLTMVGYIKSWPESKSGYFGRGSKIEVKLRFYNQLRFSNGLFRWYAWNIERKNYGFRALNDLKALRLLSFDYTDPYIPEPVLLGLDFGDKIWLLGSDHISFPEIIQTLDSELDLDKQHLTSGLNSFAASSFQIWPKSFSEKALC